MSVRIIMHQSPRHAFGRELEVTRIDSDVRNEGGLHRYIAIVVGRDRTYTAEFEHRYVDDVFTLTLEAITALKAKYPKEGTF